MRSMTRLAAGSGNSRNGTTDKTVLTDIGAVDLAVSRDRSGTFKPQISRVTDAVLEELQEWQGRPLDGSGRRSSPTP
jgi:transposase-like protein